ncbi:MAG: hypothetical protein ACE5JP_07955 [Candidatus Bipolaricaulia bacterium]
MSSGGQDEIKQQVQADRSTKMKRSTRVRWFFWGALFAFIVGEAAFWWVGARLGQWNLPPTFYTRYTVLQGESAAGLARIGMNFHHFFLFWRMPPDTQTYANLYELWLSDGSALWRNLLHLIGFFSVPFLLVGWWRISLAESFLGLVIFNVVREFIGEGWLLEPSFSDLWAGVIFALLGTWVAWVIPVRSG